MIIILKQTTNFFFVYQERLDEYRRLATVGHSFGIESSILSPEETKKIYPLIDEKVVHGSLYSPSDGTVDPSMFCTALTRSAIQAGAKVCVKLKLFKNQNIVLYNILCIL